MSTDKVFNPSEKQKLIQIINDGTNVLEEIKILNEGLNETIKAIAEEMEIKPAILKKAIKAVHKDDFHKHSDDYSVLENILATAGKI
jgi:Mn-dependent DtxR family transcriptional regulator